MFCKNCGKEIANDCINCPDCGAQLAYNDSDSIGWLCLGCCVPVAGLVLYFVWKDQKPKSAKKALIGFFICVAFYVGIYAIYIIYFLLIMFLAVITSTL